MNISSNTVAAEEEAQIDASEINIRLRKTRHFIPPRQDLKLKAIVKQEAVEGRKISFEPPPSKKVRHMNDVMEDRYLVSVSLACT